MPVFKVYTSKNNRAYSKEDARNSYNWGHEVTASSYGEAKDKVSNKLGLPAKRLSAIKIYERKRRRR